MSMAMVRVADLACNVVTKSALNLLKRRELSLGFAILLIVHAIASICT